MQSLHDNTYMYYSESLSFPAQMVKINKAIEDTRAGIKKSRHPDLIIRRFCGEKGTLRAVRESRFLANELYASKPICLSHERILFKDRQVHWKNCARWRLVNKAPYRVKRSRTCRRTWPGSRHMKSISRHFLGRLRNIARKDIRSEYAV